MAIKKLQVQIHHVSLLPRDDAVNILYYDINIPDTVEGTMDDVAAAYNLAGMRQRLNGSYAGMTIKAYDMPQGNPPLSGPPTDVKNYALPPVSIDGPCELALALSYSADDDAAGTKRRRGRIYIPWHSNDVRMRPTQAMVNVILDFGEALGSAGNAGNSTWVMFSPTDNATKKIESISCDNEWDTQRRRGLRATFRTRRDVQ